MPGISKNMEPTMKHFPDLRSPLDRLLRRGPRFDKVMDLALEGIIDKNFSVHIKNGYDLMEVISHEGDNYTFKYVVDENNDSIKERPTTVHRKDITGVYDIFYTAQWAELIENKVPPKQRFKKLYSSYE
jgi:hypothetical protein